MPNLISRRAGSVFVKWLPAATTDKERRKTLSVRQLTPFC
jgi:hypothetical protein